MNFITQEKIGERESTYQKLLSEIAERFVAEDCSTFALRNLYQTIAEESLNQKTERDLETEL